MNKIENLVQIDKVYAGSFGGAVFKAKTLNGNESLTFRARASKLFLIPRKGEFWKVTGVWETFKTTDFRNRNIEKQQILISSAQLVNIPSHTYLSSLLMRHPLFSNISLASKKIGKLMIKFRSEPLLSLLNTGNQLELSKILSTSTSQKLINNWEELQNDINASMFFTKHKFSTAIAHKVTNLSKFQTVERLEQNPYSLVCFLSEQKKLWDTIEECGRTLGFTKNDPKRLQGFVEYILYLKLQDGHTAYPLDKLTNELKKTLGNSALIGIEVALSNKSICILNSCIHNQKLVQLTGPAFIEIQLIKKINALLKPLSVKETLINISEFEVSLALDSLKNQNINNDRDKLSSEKYSAIKTSLTNRISMIRGGPGSGKTTLLKAMNDIADNLNKTVYNLAFSGKAKDILKKRILRNTMTIHSFIMSAELNKATNKHGKQSFTNLNIDLDCNPILIIDEASMVGVTLFNKLLSIFNNKPFSIVLVGDQAQISPIDFGLVFHRLNLFDVPITNLKKNYRVGKGSKINLAATSIRKGVAPQVPLWNKEEEGVFFIPCEKEVTKLHIALLKIKLNLKRIQIISPHININQPDSSILINNFIQENIDSHRESKPKSFRVNEHLITEGSPVLVTKNCYKLGLFNGNTGTLILVIVSNKVEFGVFEFDGIERTFSIEDMYDLGLELSYCISIHKSQGSEYDVIVIPCITNSNFIERSLIYTAITRSKKLCLLVGSQEIFNLICQKPNRADELYIGFEPFDPG